MTQHPEEGTLPTILIVDDLPPIHEMIKSLIDPVGYLCAGAASGEEALLRFEQTRFDVALVDYSMTSMDGLTLTHELLARDASVVVILMSGFVDEEMREAAISAGAFAVVEKPFQFDQLKEVIQGAAKEASARRQNRKANFFGDFPSLESHLAERKRAYIQTVLESVSGDRKKAAEILKIPVDEID